MAKLTNNEQQKLIGQGISFPLKLNSHDNLQLSFGINNLEESIRIILGTRLGERKYRPDFGCRLDELVFAPMNSQTLALIRLYVTEALVRWEPRIILDRVYVEVGSLLVSRKSSPEHGRLNIYINYHPKDFYESKSLVYPFYLQSPGAD